MIYFARNFWRKLWEAIGPGNDKLGIYHHTDTSMSVSHTATNTYLPSHIYPRLPWSVLFTFYLEHIVFFIPTLYNLPSSHPFNTPSSSHPPNTLFSVSHIASRHIHICFLTSSAGDKNNQSLDEEGEGEEEEYDECSDCSLDDSECDVSGRLNTRSLLRLTNTALTKPNYT